jgi:hypothetical protein
MAETGRRNYRFEPEIIKQLNYLKDHYGLKNETDTLRKLISDAYLKASPKLKTQDLGPADFIEILRENGLRLEAKDGTLYLNGKLTTPEFNWIKIHRKLSELGFRTGHKDESRERAEEIAEYLIPGYLKKRGLR